VPKNYAEDAVEWYLRLNGFFLLSNYVLHPENGTEERQGDVDILAVRPPFVDERVGGRRDHDETLLKQANDDSWIGVICEVTTALQVKKEFFRKDYLRAAVARLGLVDPSFVDAVVNDLLADKKHQRGNVGYIKLVVTSIPIGDGPFLHRPLDDIEDFLEQRAITYFDEKNSDRVYFPAGAFQSAIGWVRRHGRG